jgi:thioredoxin reductase (NADPH)
MSLRDVLIVGAGPSGLATAIALQKRGIDYLVLEKGGLVDGIARMPTNMVFFTTPELLEIGGIPMTTPYEKPTRQEALQYYRKVTDAFQLNVALHEEVLEVARETQMAHAAEMPLTPPAEQSADPDASPLFVVESRSRLGVKRARHARAVVLAMGYYGCPNLLNVPGESLPHVSHYYGEAHTYYRQRVVIVGGKNSACEAALELYRSGAQVTLVHRGSKLGDSVKYWVKPDVENRIREGSIAARFNARIVEIRPTEVVIETVGERRLWGRAPEDRQTIPADAVLLLTGYQADPAFLRNAGVELHEETLIPKHDQLTFETNVPNLFIAGGQLAGRKTGTVFIENGRFHGERIAQIIADRLK